MNEEIIEVLARIQHEIWSHWMRYMFEEGGMMVDKVNAAYNPHWVMYETKRKHWIRQMNTPYDDLSEAKKESDRQIVRQFLDFLLEEK